MKATRLYTGSDGESHFEDIEIPLKHDPRIGLRSELMKATGIIFLELGGEKHPAQWHNAPARQFAILLEGRSEMEVSDGTKRQFKPGDILLVEDTTGRGHISREFDKKPNKIMFITLD